MKLTFLGGADEVGASGTLIEIAGKKLLVDAGIRILAKTRRKIGDDQLPDLSLISEAGGIDYILITHAHTDHTGALPLVVERYPAAPVLTTAPSMALIRVLQADAQRIMKLNHEQEGELPLFDAVASGRLLDAMQPVEPRQPIRLGDGLQATFHISGHIMGAASIVLESSEGTLVMSGDLSLTAQRAVTKAAIPNIKADALVLESTYGGRLHANRAAEEKRLIETLRTVSERGGKTLIPAFALGRAQEVLQILLAKRDQIDVPIYADGMVRAVCAAYSQFADWLPEQTVKAAGDEPLFFRKQVKAVETQAQRAEIANGAAPCVIVASSGMLTGGASAYYAEQMAGDARNAILLTGYQDEESPGRAIQKAIADRKRQDSITLRISGKPVTVRCELGTYSLSAHADEAELVNIAEAFGANDVMLVHGDAEARDSLARALRARQKIVRLPESGTAVTLEYQPLKAASKPKKKSGSETAAVDRSAVAAVDTAAIWEQVKGQPGFYTAAELAQIAGIDAAQIAAALKADNLYFIPDMNGERFQVRTPEQVEAIQRRRAIMAAYPSLANMIVVLRDAGGKARLAHVQRTSADGFEAIAAGTKTTHFSSDALVYPIAPYVSKSAQKTRSVLNHLARSARGWMDALLSFEVRRALVESGERFDPRTLIAPEELLPPPMPPLSGADAALMAIAFRLAHDGAELYPDGTLRTHAVVVDEPMEQNAARQLAVELFPAESRLRKVGMEVGQRRIVLSFDFPDIAAEQYADLMDELSERSGWDVTVSPTVTQQALQNALLEIMPAGTALARSLSYFMDKRELHAELTGDFDADALAGQFNAMTGFTLRINPKLSGADSVSTPEIVPSDAREPIEINAAYAAIRAALESHGLMRAGLKNGQIVLTFISPQVGARHRETLARLSSEVGYGLTLHPHPDQAAILLRVNQAVRAAGWQVRKGPGLRTDRGEVTLSLAASPPAEQIAAVRAQIEAETGYTLVIA